MRKGSNGESDLGMLRGNNEGEKVLEKEKNKYLLVRKGD